MSYCDTIYTARGGKTALERNRMRDTKLNRTQELEICQLWAGGMTQTAICKKYHIGTVRLWRIIDKHNARSSETEKALDTTEKNKSEFAQGWDVVTAAMRGEISKRTARRFCKRKISYEEVMEEMKGGSGTEVN